MTASANPSPAAAPGHRSDRYLMVDGARLRFRDEGAGAAVLLVHGWTLDLEMWDPQVGALRDAFRMVRLDRRGHGLSGGEPDTARDGADLAALCEHLGLERVALLGMSQGVRGTLAFAGAARGRISALILDGPPDFEGSAPEDDVPMERYRRLVSTGGLAAFRQEWARHPLMQLRTRIPSAHELLAAMIERYPGNDLKSHLARERPAELPALEAMSVPTLIVSGAQDLPGRLRTAQQLRARLPAAEHAMIAAAGHLPNLDDPVAYNALCRAFLASHTGASPRS